MNRYDLVIKGLYEILLKVNKYIPNELRPEIENRLYQMLEYTEDDYVINWLLDLIVEIKSYEDQHKA